MKDQPVVFVATQEYNNLGVGYMSALLSQSGFETFIIDIRNTKEDVLEILKRLNPLLIGLSVIYQYHIGWFREVVKYLRRNGIRCHITAGGHYASLRSMELFELIPELDSIVRFEGEYTLTELAMHINNGKDWRKIKSIVYKSEGRVVTNPLRALENDLDKFPYPFRAPLTEYALNKKFATILAGRGCIYNCSFCNQRIFYYQPNGPVKRIRRPELVVKEVDYLFTEKECSVFLFDDDDFPVKSHKGSEWIFRFCNELKARGLDNKIMWKINCRPDEVDEEIFRTMKRHGLFLVFLGLEDGTDAGLKRLKKHMTVKKCLNSINILKKLDISFDYGFLLFQPETTYRSLNENLEFLKKICCDGYAPATFLKVMPYYETLIEKQLIKEGRINGTPGFFDYDFHEKSLNRYYEYIIYIFNEWLRDPDGLVNISKWANNYISVFSHYSEITPEVQLIIKKVKDTISESNLFLLDTMKNLAILFETNNFNDDSYDDLNSYKEDINLKHRQLKKQINNSMQSLLTIWEIHKNKNMLLLNKV